MDAALDASPVTAGPSAVTRVTIALTPKAAADLASLQARTGLSKTDTVNRAVSLYWFVESATSEGSDLLLRRDGETQQVRFL